jgi:hypothetical protein
MGRFLLLSLFIVAIASPAFARSHEGRASVGNDITIAEDETADNVACAFCSVHVRGHVKGNIAVFLGSISVDADHSIDGNVAVAGGDVHLGEEATIGGNAAVMAGEILLASEAAVHGQQAVLPGRFWLVLLLLPILIPIGIIWLIVYLIRRNQYRFPAYPNGRGF